MSVVELVLISQQELLLALQGRIEDSGPVRAQDHFDSVGFLLITAHWTVDRHEQGFKSRDAKTERLRPS